MAIPQTQLDSYLNLTPAQRGWVSFWVLREIAKNGPGTFLDVEVRLGRDVQSTMSTLKLKGLLMWVGDRVKNEGTGQGGRLHDITDNGRRVLDGKAELSDFTIDSTIKDAERDVIAEVGKARRQGVDLGHTINSAHNRLVRVRLGGDPDA